jgi:hypothetical protein
MKNLKNTFVLVIVTTAVALAVSCQSAPQEGHPDVLNVSETPVPEWTKRIEPVGEGGYMYFVGRSRGVATERGAVADARRDVGDQVLEYLGGYAEREYEERALQHGLTSSVIDPTVAAKEMSDFTYRNYVSQNPPKEVYWEYRRTPGGDAYFAYVYQAVPVNQASEDFRDAKIEEAQSRVRQAQTDEAKDQAQRTLEYWEQTDPLFQE